MMLYGPAKPRTDGLGGLQRVMQARLAEAGLPEAACVAWCRVMAYACRGLCWHTTVEKVRREMGLRSMSVVPEQLAGFFEVRPEGLLLTAAGHEWVRERGGEKPLMDTDKH